MDRRIVNLEELDVDIQEVDTVDHLIGIFTSCRNIKKFTLRTYPMGDADLSRIFRTILPIFSELEELDIDDRNYHAYYVNLNEMFDVIFSSCPNLRELRVPKFYIEEAENYFHNSNIIIFEFLEF
jgi:hypothetical protein